MVSDASLCTNSLCWVRLVALSLKIMNSFIQQRANSNLTRSPQLLHISTLQYSIEAPHLHRMSIKVGKEMVKSSAAGSDSIKYFECIRFSLVRWVRRPLRAHSGYACDFRYGSQPAAAVYCCGAICLVGPCWLHVIRHQMGCHDPSILPSQPLTQRAGEVSVTHSITLPAVSIITRKTQSYGRVVVAE